MIIRPTRFLRLLLLASALFLRAPLISAADTDPIQQTTGVALPKEMAGFVRGEPLDFETNQAGSGVAVQYEKVNAYSATVYVYTAGLDPFPTSLDDPAIVKQRLDSADALLQMAMKTSPLARRTGGSVWQARTQPGPTPVATDTFIVYPKGSATNDSLFLWLAKGHIWKVRITRASSYRGDEGSVPFVKEVVQHSVAQ